MKNSFVFILGVVIFVWGILWQPQPVLANLFFHFMGGFIPTYLLTQNVWDPSKDKLNIMLACGIIGLVISVYWEIIEIVFEFGGDFLDTLQDLLMGFIGGSLVLFVLKFKR